MEYLQNIDLENKVLDNTHYRLQSKMFSDQLGLHRILNFISNGTEDKWLDRDDEDIDIGETKE